MRLDPTSLQPEDSWTVPASQSPLDSDFGGSPTSWVADVGGVSTQMVGASNKNGFFYAWNDSDLAAGPVWEYRIGCYLCATSGDQITAAVWDNATGQLFLSGNEHVINGNHFYGSVQDVDPATGAPVWQTGLPGVVMGTPTLDGAGVLAVGTMSGSATCSTPRPAPSSARWTPAAPRSSPNRCSPTTTRSSAVSAVV